MRFMSKKNIMNNSNKIYDSKYFMMILMNLLFSLSLGMNNNLYSLLAIACLMVLIIFGNTLSDFYTYIFLIPFSSLVTVHGKDIFFVFLFISSFKLIAENHNKKVPIIWILSFFSIISIEFIYDFLNCNIGNFMYILAVLTYFFIFINYIKIKDLSLNYMINCIISTSFLAIFVIFLISGGNWEVFITSTDIGFRFGAQASDLGGSMGVPIYCLTILSCSFISLLKIRSQLIKKVFLIVIMIFSVIVGLMTISRVFITGLITFIALVLLSIIQEKKKGKLSAIVILTIIVFAIFFYYNIDIVLNFIEKIVLRNSEDISTGRFYIWKDCVEYLYKNPIALLFGRGTLNYIQIGAYKSYKFSMSAHNLFLDGLMSWGICGFSIFIFALYKFLKNNCKELKMYITILMSIPLIVWLSMSLTMGSFNYFKTYMYILAFVLISINCLNELKV